MSENDLGKVIQIARTLVDHLPDDMNTQLKDLIAKAEAGQITKFQIIDLFGQHKTTRVWMRQQITSHTRRDGPPTKSPAGYSGLAGNPSVPLSQRWVCPEMPAEHWVMVIQDGEKPPLCKIHNARMIRGGQ